MPKKKSVVQDEPVIMPPSPSIEGRENEVIAAAYALAEKQIREGTASAMVLTHFLKLGTSRNRLEQDILIEQRKLIRAKTEDIDAHKSSAQKYEEVLRAFRAYNGFKDEAE